MILHRDVSEDLRAFLAPELDLRKCSRQVLVLEDHGYSACYTQDHHDSLRKLGSVVARTRLDGGMWPYERAREMLTPASTPPNLPLYGEFALWAPSRDIHAAIAIRKFVANGVGFGSVEPSQFSIEQLLALLRSLSEAPNLAEVCDPTDLAAADSLLRLNGTFEAVLPILEHVRRACAVLLSG